MPVKTTTYTPEELKKIFDNHGRDYMEGSMPHQVFEELKRRVDNGIELSYTESRYFYTVVKLVVDGIYGKVEDYDVCYEHDFMNLFRIYAPNNLGCNLSAKDKYGEVIPLEQRRKDAIKLDAYFSNWTAILNSPITDSKIQVIKNEIEKDNTKLLPLAAIYGANYMRSQRRMVYLRAKYVLNTALGILDLNGEEIDVGTTSFTVRFNPKSQIHILYRHYGQIMKPSQIVGEDYFTEDFNYEKLGSIIKEFLNKIHNCGYSVPLNDAIHIKFKNLVYTIVIRRSTVITFYPVSKTVKLQILASQYNLHHIDDDLYLYVKK